MMWIFLLFAWELTDSRRSMFDGITKDVKAWAHRFWRNQFLFWSVVLGFVLTVATLYIPVIDDVVFMHKGITWEWAVVVIAMICFVSAAETYKFIKRAYFRKIGQGPEKTEEEDGYASGQSSENASA